MKKGFTLAEVLITLGIIGVVAALTAPALVQNAGSAKVGPTLAKAVTTFEVANQNLLSATDSPTLKASPAGNGTDYASSNKAYIEALSDYMKISFFDDNKSSEKYSATTYNGKSLQSGGTSLLQGSLLPFALAARQYALSKDGVLYIIDAFAHENYANPTAPVHKQLFGHVLIDINGKTKPNALGKDLFAFSIAQDGTLRPVGSNQWSLTDEKYNQEYNWQNGSKDKCNENEVTTGWSCAGSIYENNLKVIYQ